MSIQSGKIALRRLYNSLRPQPLHWQYNRLPHYDRRAPFVVLWSQKSASTTVLKWFFELTGILDTALDYHPFAHRYETDVYKRQPGYAAAVEKALKSADVPVVKFVRDPAARAFSGYLFINRKLRGDVDDGDTRHWRRRILKFLSRPQNGGPFKVSFNDYLRWLAETRPRNLDGHLAPQYTKIEAQIADRLTAYKVEEIESAFAEIGARFGLTPIPEERMSVILKSDHHIRKDGHRRMLEKIFREGLDGAVDNSEPLPPLTTELLAAYPETKALLEAYYHQDYAAYGYGAGG